MNRSAGTMKRSAGTTNRQSGTRRGSELSARRGGAESRSAVTTTRPTFRSPGADAAAAGDDASTTTNSADLADSPDMNLQGPVDSESSEGEEPEVVDYGARTLGKSCMYGVRGEVIYRPRGADCRGEDRAAPRAPSPAVKRPEARPKRSGPAAIAPRSAAAPAGRQRSTEKEERPRSRGTCIYGAGDRVVYAPPGVDCRR